jgi:hypothetical protein
MHVEDGDHLNLSKPHVTEGPIAPSLDAGVRFMCLNQILFDEQIALIGYHAARDPAQTCRHRGQLAAASRLVASYPYPHRPYYPWAGVAGRCAATSPLHTGNR